MKKLLAIFYCIHICAAAVQAQNDDQKQQVLNLMQQLAATYRNTPRLSFDVRYKYAAEEAPATILDSVQGHFKMSGNRYWYDLDNTEGICTAEYLIMLFKEDKIMYLAKPAAKAVQGVANPVVLLDSFLVRNKNVSCRLEQQNNRQVITLAFSGASAYRKIEYYVNQKTGLLEKTVNVIRAEELYDASVRSLVNGPVTYAIVEADYNNYRFDGFDDGLFDYNHYFKKQGTEYMTVAPFDAYKIFLGSPNL